MDFFKGVKAIVICKVFGLTKASGDIIKKNIEKYGGIADIYDEDLSGHYTHVIVPSMITKDYLENLIKKGKFSDDFIIVNEKWAYESFVNKELLSTELYK